MKKIIVLGISSFLASSVLISGGKVSASSIEEELTQDYVINWEEAWSSVDELDEVVDFGVKENSGGISLLSYSSLATGSTKVTGTSSTVTSTGSTKGKAITTVTSATTSIRDVARGVTSNGPKRMGLGDLAATSKTSIGNHSGSSPYTGLTVHTATSGSKLYTSSTGNTKAF